MQEISLLEMLKSGVHFGHQKKRWHPQMKPYIYTMRGGVHIIDLEKTAEKLQAACDFVSSVISQGGTILFVATKQQAKEIARKQAEATGMPYVVERWLGGTLTNFENISKLVQRLKELRTKKEKGELAKYTKREQLQFDEEIQSLGKVVGGIESMGRLPQALFIIDIKKEKTALSEARKKNIPVVGVVDTNSNPKLVDYPIPANDDASKSIAYLADAIAAAIVEGQKNKQAAPVGADKENKQGA